MVSQGKATKGESNKDKVGVMKNKIGIQNEIGFSKGSCAQGFGVITPSFRNSGSFILFYVTKGINK